jgi:hypothetical protein
MSSDKQLIANQANARKSTGPRTAAGKDKTRYNALKHGLSAEQMVIPGENPADYAALGERLMRDFAPENVLEEDLVARLTGTLWRLRRIPLLENAYFAYCQHKRLWDTDYLLDPMLELPGVPSDLHEKVWAPWKTEDRETLKTIGRIVEDALSANVLPKLSMYEAKLLRQFERLLAQLERLCDRRPQIPAVAKEEATIVDAESDALDFDPDALTAFMLSS